MDRGPIHQALSDAPPAVKTPFVWPPVPTASLDEPSPPASPPTTDRAQSTSRSPGRLRRFLEEAEEFWLSPVALPLARRVEASLWAPDDFARYCNRCAQSVGLGEDDEFGCAECRGRRLAWCRAVRLGAFEGDLAGWVREVKFARNASLGVELGRALAGRLLDAGLPEGRVCVIPIPMSRRERLVKGLDHARCIAEGVAKGLEAPLVAGLKRSHRPSQRSMPSVAARERNARGAFSAASGVDLRGWTAVLVDDVITTGATMRAAGKALRPGRQPGQSAALWAAAVAVTPDPERRDAGVILQTAR
jgi:predicted amidophosphoribosyltransferase